ncbi:3-methyl-2-oxobutanoate hydroxymethyltransferase-like [Brevipalpus obovatus]|uniref:3-methyl-2-oxobutanoate hydroxymethyltransferase-like n=1 Tax=Brevipalpus obovatus TaxID=246614 RepID=UPI003D9EDF97
MIEEHREKRKVRTVDLVSMKQRGRKIKCLTCYDYSFASILNRTNLDLVLVGDSAGHVMQGKSNTLSVTMEHMRYHVECVAAAIKRPLLVADMPFLAIGPDMDKTARNAGALMTAGAEAIKAEGASKSHCLQYEYLVSIGIPVMGHIGMQPQSVNVYGGFRIQGKGGRLSDRLEQEAKDLENSGCFAAVLELTDPSVATALSKSVKIPIIGIGAGNECDGNILVLQDMLGMNTSFKPKFLKHFANLDKVIRESVDEYCREVDAKTSEPI